MNQIQKQKEAYYKQQGIAPGVPTMKGAYGDPENTKRGYNSIIDTLGNHDVPQGWIQTPRPNTTPNTNPGPPVSWNDPSNPDDPQVGYGYIPNDTTKEEIFFYHSDHLGSTSYITDDGGNSMMPTCHMVNCWLTSTHHPKTCHTSSMAKRWMRRLASTITVNLVRNPSA